MVMMRRTRWNFLKFRLRKLLMTFRFSMSVLNQMRFIGRLLVSIKFLFFMLSVLKKIGV